MIDSVPQQQQPKKKNWSRKKNVKNLSLDLDSHVPVMQTPVKVVYPTDIPENTSQPPLKELEKLVESIKPEVPQPPQYPIQPPVETQVLEEGEIPDSGNYQYGTLEELLASVGVCYHCPIHNEGMNEIHSQKEWIQDVFLKCQVENCPVFTTLKDYNSYYDGCRRQGNDWFTLARTATMKCECGETPTLSMSKSEKNFLQLRKEYSLEDSYRTFVKTITRRRVVWLRSNRRSIYFVDLQEGLQIARAMGNATKLEELTGEDIFEIAKLIGFEKFQKVSSRLNVSEDELDSIRYDLVLYEQLKHDPVMFEYVRNK
ncbi:hypothetical protein AWC38_SpisGene22627 [Stylophora pistillata]|uniref:Uncharacterized protein n=1 Tax=Stylophora pistillata TaxID=50429 RepID=A0A2B4RA86_STYPI|nr:hypothetical protein AWC38_SpisGene22627 [Stylophora pistillata]